MKKNWVMKYACLLEEPPYFYIYDTTTNSGDFIINEAATSSGGAGVKAAQIIVDHCVDRLITPRFDL